MPIESNPPYNPLSLYRPCKWRMEVTSANPVEVAIAEVYANGSLITTITSNRPVGIIGNTYFFAFDVQDILQRLTAPLSTTPTTVFNGFLTPSAYNGKAIDLHRKFYISVTYLYRDPTTNRLLDLGVVDVTPLYEGTITTRQQWEAQDLSDYICVLASGAGKFLTNQPQPYNICRDEFLALTFIPYLSNAYEVTTYDSAGAVIDTGTAALLPSADYVPQVLGVGLQELQGITWLTGTVDPTDPNIASYTITIGTSGPPFIASSVTQTYNIVNCCEDRAFRIHFLNRLGGGDAYTFNNAKTEKQTSKSSIGQAPLFSGFTASDFHYIYSKGKIKYNATGERKYTLETTIYDEETGEWLAELLQSPETYLETEDGLLPIIIEDSEIETSDTARLLTLKVSVQDANDVIVQRM